ncbi:MAG: DUF502 domain-containing protein [Phycisphaerae bacterium]|nr:DUF502 domain-containing protein [Phycisphaerae bacterium]NIR64680.1 DUF502 domain-containing protein [candidate division Zixibacteria bacterium]NIP51943.1 DUF502 domain-containing protein [Phycisphaerae bacterium]NIS51064.1 DUF502 domain-containing protein [Phycisphaerae bacterium]NIU08679.1 DUF502 domain-containing protein [Phycisphaerae bacterium]
MSLSRRFRNYFLRGLAVLLPTVLTIWIFVLGYQFIQANLGSHLKNGLEWLMGIIAPASFVDRLDEKWWEVAKSAGSFLIAVLAVCLVGALLASVVGRSLWRMIESFIMNTPLLRRVYPYIKQITDFVLTQEEQKRMFSRVVAVEYPRKGIWSIGFVTGTGIQKVVDNVKKEFLTILIPTSPTPFTGFVIMVPKKQTIEMNMTIEEALRFTVSAGVIAPGSDRMAALPKAVAEKIEE